MKDKKEQIKDLTVFMLAKSTTANVEPVFTMKDGKEIVLGENLTALLNDVLEQAFIPFLAEELVNAGYCQRDNPSNSLASPYVNLTPSDNIEEAINRFFDGKCGEQSCWFGFEGEERTCRHCLAEYLKEKGFYQQDSFAAGVARDIFEDIAVKGLIGNGIILTIEEFNEIQNKYQNKTN